MRVGSDIMHEAEARSALTPRIRPARSIGGPRKGATCYDAGVSVVQRQHGGAAWRRVHMMELERDGEHARGKKKTSLGASNG